MDPNRMSCIYQKFNMRNNSGGVGVGPAVGAGVGVGVGIGASVGIGAGVSVGRGKKEAERLTFKRRHLELGTDSSLDCTSSSSDTDGELSKLREENRRLRRVAKHYRRKYINAKERCRDVSSLNVELQKRLFEATPMQTTYETPPSSMTYSMNQHSNQGHHYVMNQEEMMQQPQQGVLDETDGGCDDESPGMYSNDQGNEEEESAPEDMEVKGHNMFVECIPAQEPVCELSQNDDSNPTQPILSEEKLQAASCVRCGQAGDSLFVKNLALAIWGAKTLSSRSVTGKRCMAIRDSVAKPPLSPRKVDFIKEKFIQRIQQNEPNVSPIELGRRVQKIRSYIADKIATLNRRST